MRRRKRRRKVYSGANAVNEKDPERDRATQVGGGRKRRRRRRRRKIYSEARKNAPSRG